MKVLHIIKDLEPGGIQSLLLDVLSNQSFFDGEIALFVMGHGRLHSKFQAIQALKIYSSKRRQRLDFKVIAALRKAVKDFQADIVHTHHSAEMLHAWWALKKYPAVKKVHSFHVSPAVQTRADRYIYKRLINKFDLLLAPSKALKSELGQAGFSVEQIQVIHNGVDPKRVQSSIPKEEARKKLGLPQEGFIIGMAGSFYNNIRDQETLCRAMPLLKGFEKPVYLAFAGATESAFFKNNSYYQRCVKLCQKLEVEDKVFFLENVEPVNTFYKALDLCVHSSKHDSFGLSPLEALFNNLPLLLSDLKVFREVFQTNLNTSFFQPANNQHLAVKISELLKEPKHRTKTGFQHFLNLYGINVHLKHLQLNYAKIIQSSITDN